MQMGIYKAGRDKLIRCIDNLGGISKLPRLMHTGNQRPDNPNVSRTDLPRYHIYHTAIDNQLIERHLILSGFNSAYAQSCVVKIGGLRCPLNGKVLHINSLRPLNGSC